VSMTSDSADKKAPTLDFNALVLSLGSSAIVHLGEAPDPTTGQKSPPDFGMAQQSIDLLSMLEEKTRGNLTDEERRFLDGMLYDLRMLFVQVSQRPRAAAPAAAAAAAAAEKK
jgi:hypothetical protein